MRTPSRWGRKGPEQNDPTPVEAPLGASRPTPLHDIIARMVRQAVHEEKGDEFETPEEADDFEEEDPDTYDLSPYELAALQEETPIRADSLDLPDPEDPPMTGDAPDPNEPEPSQAIG